MNLNLVVRHIKTGAEFRDAVRRSGGTITDGPVPEPFVKGWGVHPMVGDKPRAHYWFADRTWQADPNGPYGLVAACRVTSVATKQIHLLGQGNAPHCVRCEQKLMKAMRAALA